MGSIHVIGGAAAEIIGSPWLSTLTRVMDHWVESGEEVYVGVGVGVRWKICRFKTKY
jgi:hypothetical protein